MLSGKLRRAVLVVGRLVTSLFKSGVANSGTNTAFTFDTVNALSGTTKLVEVQNQGTAKWTLEDNGIQLLPNGAYIRHSAGSNENLWVLSGTSVIRNDGSGITRLVGTNTDQNGARGVYAGTAATWSHAGARLFSINNNATEKVAWDTNGLECCPDFTDDSATTGNRTVNKLSGWNAFAAGGTAVTITNSLVTTTGTRGVDVQLLTNDATAQIKNVTIASGSFTVNLSAAATGTTVFYWRLRGGA